MKKIFLIIASLSLLMFSCNNDTNVITEEKSPTIQEVVKSDIAFLVTCGMNEHDIAINNSGDGYIYKGVHQITRDEISKHRKYTMTKKQTNNSNINSLKSSLDYSNIISKGKARELTIHIGTQDGDWIYAINSAIDNYNNLLNCSINITTESSSNCDINFFTYENNNNYSYLITRDNGKTYINHKTAVSTHGARTHAIMKVIAHKLGLNNISNIQFISNAVTPNVLEQTSGTWLYINNYSQGYFTENDINTLTLLYPEHVDASFRCPEMGNKIYFFKNSEYYKYYEDYPSNPISGKGDISRGWRGLFPNNLDAAIDAGPNSDILYMFKDGVYAKYSKSSDQLLYNNNINSYTWPGLSPNIDAAVNVSDHILFFLNNTVLPYSVAEDRANGNYRPITNIIRNFPFDYVDAAFKAKSGYVYFISGNEYYSIPFYCIEENIRNNNNNITWNSGGPYTLSYMIEELKN